MRDVVLMRVVGNVVRDSFRLRAFALSGGLTLLDFVALLDSIALLESVTLLESVVRMRITILLETAALIMGNALLKPPIVLRMISWPSNSELL